MWNVQANPTPPCDTPALRRVLIVEDDAATRNAMRRLLEHHAFRVTAAGTVAEAMGHLHDPFDAVLVDLMLPDGHGGDIVRWARDHAPATRVLVLTGCNDPAVLRSVAAAGPCRLMHKPVEFADVLAQLTSA